MTTARWIDAAHQRAAVSGVPFIAITGSCGKTTTKALAAGILEAALTGTTSLGSGNCGDDVATTVARVSPTDDFCLQELGAWGPGTLDAGLRLVQPSIGVVLNVRRDHHSAFRTLASTATEKGKVVASLPPAGTAVLNADDDLVWAMQDITAARTLTFGRSTRADLRATEISADWPDRLSFRLKASGRVHRVATRLIGEHCLGSALAAIAIAVSMGVPIETAVAELARLEPPARRMSAAFPPDGVTFIRDDFKAPSDSLPEVLRFMVRARAARKALVIGRISDYPGRSRRVYEGFALDAAQVVDELVFVGERPDELWGGRQRPWDLEGRAWRAHIRVFRDVREASRHIAGWLQRGDLVLLKGSGPVDHLERIMLDHTVRVACWRSHCGRVVACDDCDLLDVAAAPET